MERFGAVVFDVETYRTREAEVVERLTREAIAKRPAESAKKDVKSQWDTSAARQARADEAVGSTSVDVTLAEVVCICAGAPGGEAEFTCSGDDEVATLHRAADWLDNVAGPDTVWAGHNIAGFDLSILLNRWRRFGIRPPRHFPVYAGGRWRGRVFDTMTRIPSRSGFVSLEEACRMHRVPMRDVMWRGDAVDGSRVGALVDAGEWTVLEVYCGEDVAAEGRLYEALTLGGAWGCFDRGIWEQVSELRGASGLSDGARALAIVALLERSGVI